MKENTGKAEMKILKTELNQKAKESDGAIKSGATIEKAKKMYFELKAIKGKLKNDLQD